MLIYNHWLYFMENSNQGEELLWHGRPSASAQIKMIQIIFSLILLSLVVFALGEIINPEWHGPSMLFYASAVMGLSSLLIFWASLRSKWKNVVYYVTNLKMCWKSETEKETLLISQINSIKVKKSWLYDIRSLNTGQIKFYLQDRAEFGLSFSRVENVDAVASLLNELLLSTKR